MSSESCDCDGSDSLEPDLNIYSPVLPFRLLPVCFSVCFSVSWLCALIGCFVFRVTGFGWRRFPLKKQWQLSIKAHRVCSARYEANEVDTELMLLSTDEFMTVYSVMMLVYFPFVLQLMTRKCNCWWHVNICYICVIYIYRSIFIICWL